MIQPLKTLLFSEKKPSTQFLFYIISGLTVATVQFATFVIGMLLTAGLYLVATTIANCVAIVTSFTLQRYVTFAKADERERTVHLSVVLFLLNAGLSLVLNLIIMYTGVELLLLDSFVAQIASMTILSAYNFVVYRFIFK